MTSFFYISRVYLNLQLNTRGKYVDGATIRDKQIYREETDGENWKAVYFLGWSSFLKLSVQG